MLVCYQKKADHSQESLLERNASNFAYAKKVYGVALLIISAVLIAFGALLSTGLVGVGNTHYAAAAFIFAGAFSIALSSVLLTDGRC